MKEKPKKTSEIIAEIIEECSEDGAITVEDFLKKMGNRAQAMAILVFSLSCVVAGVIPGFSTLTAIPIMLIGMQIVLGMKSVWLPHNIRDKTISPRVIKGALAKSVPTLRMVETFLKPRLSFLTHPYVARFIALIIVVLAGLLALPIPGGNFLPSIGISILALSIVERDGLFVLLAVLLVAGSGTLMIDILTKGIAFLIAFF